MVVDEMGVRVSHLHESSHPMESSFLTISGLRFLANSALLLFSRWYHGPPPPPVTQAKLDDAIDVVFARASNLATNLAAAQERILGLEELLKLYKELLKEAKE